MSFVGWLVWSQDDKSMYKQKIAHQERVLTDPIPAFIKKEHEQGVGSLAFDFLYSIFSNSLVLSQVNLVHKLGLQKLFQADK